MSEKTKNILRQIDAALGGKIGMMYCPKPNENFETGFLEFALVVLKEEAPDKYIQIMKEAV